MGKNSKTIIAILLVFGVMFYAYVSFFNNSGTPTDETASEDASSTDASGDVGEQLVTLLDQLKTIRMDGSIFTSSQFLALRDETAAVVNQPIGRNNPFAPVGTDGAFISNFTFGNDSQVDNSLGSQPVDQGSSTAASSSATTTGSSQTGF